MFYGEHLYCMKYILFMVEILEWAAYPYLA